MNILIIEDDTALNQLIYFTISESNSNCYQAFNAKEAYIILEKNKIDIVLIDYRLPDANGYDIANFIINNYPDITFIVATGNGDEKIAVEMMKLGAFDYLIKDTNFIEILQAVIQKAKKNIKLKLELFLANKKNLENEILYSTLVEHLPDLIIIHRKTRILFINNSCLNLLGFSPNEIINKSLFDFLSKNKIDELNYYFRNKVIKTIENEIEVFTKDKVAKYFTIHTSEINYKGKNSALTVLTDITERKQYQDLLFQTIIKTQEDERKRLAEDLHDDLGPILSCIKLYSNLIMNNDKTEEEKITYSSTLLSLSDNAINCTRAISQNLMPNLLSDFGLSLALQNFVTTINNLKTVCINYESNLEIRLDTITEIVMYRVLTELINNTLRHAKATKINIELNYNFSELIVKYSDNGRGFSSENVKKLSMGLNNIKNRLKSINADYQLKNTNGIEVIISKRIKNLEI